MEPRPDSEVLTAYLLGELPEDRAASIEDAYVVDDELFEELRATETDLVDAYAAGALSDRRTAAFEERLLVSAEQRERVAFARALAAKAEAAAAPAPARAGLWDRVRSFFTVRTMAVAGAAALALVIGVQVLGPGGDASSDPAAVTLQSTRLRSAGTPTAVSVSRDAQTLRITLEIDDTAGADAYRVALLDEGKGTRTTFEPVETTAARVIVEIPATALGTGPRTLALTDAAGTDLAFYELLVRR